MSNTNRIYFYSILGSYLVMGFLYSFLVPNWQAPDEPGHYNYIRQLSDFKLPILEVGDYDSEFLLRIRKARFADDAWDKPISSIQYEDWQPPAYYMLLTPVYWLSDGSLRYLRIASVVMGLLIVLLSFHATKLIFPENDTIALCAMAVVALLPQHTANLSAVNNDVMAEIVAAGIFCILLNYHAAGSAGFLNRNRDILLGTLLGIGFVTKGTTLAFVIPIAYVVCRLPKDLKSKFHIAIKIAVPAVMIGGVWWVRNIRTYGNFDFLGKAIHDRVIQDQLLTFSLIEQYGLMPTLRFLARNMGQSFFGKFGWMEVKLPNALYGGFFVVVAVALLGLLLESREFKRTVTFPSRRYAQLKLALVWCFGVGLLFLLYNLQFAQPQGRYLFTALIPFAIGLAFGLHKCTGLLEKRIGTRHISGLLPAVAALALVAVNVYSIFYLIVPLLAPT